MNLFSFNNEVDKVDNAALIVDSFSLLDTGSLSWGTPPPKKKKKKKKILLHNNASFYV